MIKLALITEEFDGQILTFDTVEEADAFSHGFSRAGDSYGAGHCAAYTLKEVQESSGLDDETKKRMIKKLQ